MLPNNIYLFTFRKPLQIFLSSPIDLIHILLISLTSKLCLFYLFLNQSLVWLLMISKGFMIFEIKSVMIIIIRYLNMKSFIIGEQPYVNSVEFMITRYLRHRIVIICFIMLLGFLLTFPLVSQQFHGLRVPQKRIVFLVFLCVQYIHLDLSNMMLHILSPLRH